MSRRITFLAIVLALIFTVNAAQGKKKPEDQPQPSQPVNPSPPPQPAMPVAAASAYPTQCPPAGQKVSVAIYPIKPAGADASLAAAMSQLLGAKLTPSPKLKVIEEAMLKTVMERQALNASDACDDTYCQVEIGKLVKAQKMVTGGISKLGSKYILALNLVDIQTGANEFSTEDQCACLEDQLDQLVGVAAAKVRNHFCEQIPLAAPAQPLTSPIAAASPGGSALVYLLYTANPIMGTPLFQIDNSQKFKLPKNACVKTAIAPGNHTIVAFSQSISYQAQDGGAYYFEAHFSPGPRMALSPVPGSPVPQWVPTCQDLSQIQTKKK